MIRSALVIPVLWLLASPMARASLSGNTLFLESGIDIVWQKTLPLGNDETLRELAVLGDAVYLSTSNYYMHAFSAKDASLLFSHPFSIRGADMFPLILSKDVLYISSGRTINKLDPRTGEMAEDVKLPFRLNGASAIAFESIYMPGADGRIHVYRTSDKLPKWRGSPGLGLVPTNIVAAEKNIVFTTLSGAIMAVSPYEPQVLWRYNTGGMQTPLVSDSYAVYAASYDTNLYKLDAATGHVLWHFLTGHRLTIPPRVTADTVYQPSGDNGVYALNKKTGKMLWQEKDAVDFLSQTKSTAYLLGKSQAIIMVDRASGKRIRQINAVGMNLCWPNTVSELIYIGGSDGRAACLQPMQ